MKEVCVFILLSFMLFGCNKNPNKGARIEKLEIEILESIENIKKLEARVEKLEATNIELKENILRIENN